MKKLTKIIFAIMILALSTMKATAQDYKHPFGLVYKDKKSVEKKSEIVLSNNPVKTNANYVDGNNNLVDPNTGKILGRAPKNGSFVYYFQAIPNDTFNPSRKANSQCVAKGAAFPHIHENYKHPGACGYHCLEWYRE